jgi:hypothetical protein
MYTSILSDGLFVSTLNLESLGGTVADVVSDGMWQAQTTRDCP